MRNIPYRFLFFFNIIKVNLWIILSWWIILGNMFIFITTSNWWCHIILQVSFPNLEKLILNDLSKLKDIWHHQLLFGSFYNLQILRVYKCPCLLNLIPSHLIHNFQNLKEMDVQDCKLLEHVIVPQGIDEILRSS